MINSIGNLAGFAGPYAMGAIKDWTGSYSGGLLCLSAVGFVAMAIVLIMGHDSSLQHAPLARDREPAGGRLNGPAEALDT